MVSRAVEAARWPRRSGRSSAAQPLAVSRSHRWASPVKSSVPGSPSTASCHTSLACSRLRVRQRAVQLGQQRPQQRPGVVADGGARHGGQVEHAGGAPGVQQVHQAAQRVRPGPQPRVGAPLHARQQLRDDTVGQPAQHDGVSGGAGRAGVTRPDGQGGAGVPAAAPVPRRVMRVAQPVPACRRRRARRHDAGAERGQRRHVAAGQPLPERQAQMAFPLPLMGAAQPVRRPARARAAGHLAGPVTAGPADARPGQELLPPQVAVLPPGQACLAQVRRDARRGGAAAGHRAFFQAQQRVGARRGERHRGRLPAGPGQEIRAQRRPQHLKVIPGRAGGPRRDRELRGHRRTP